MAGYDLLGLRLHGEELAPWVRLSHALSGGSSYVPNGSRSKYRRNERLSLGSGIPLVHFFHKGIILSHPGRFNIN